MQQVFTKRLLPGCRQLNTGRRDVKMITGQSFTVDGTHLGVHVLYRMSAATALPLALVVKPPVRIFTLNLARWHI